MFVRKAIMKNLKVSKLLISEVILGSLLAGCVISPLLIPPLQTNTNIPPTVTYTLTLTPTITITPTLTSTLTLTPSPTLEGTPTPIGGGNGMYLATDSRGWMGGIALLNADLEVVKYLVYFHKIGYIEEVSYNAAWSPDGKKIAYMIHFVIAFLYYKESTLRSYYGVYLMNPDGTQQTRLFVSQPSLTWHRIIPSLSWSPDGEKIAFNSNLNSNLQIYIINMDGSGLTQLTKRTTEAINPSWSPDGSKIVYSEINSSNMEESDLYFINLEDSEVIQLTDLPGKEFYPVWSPNGTKIAFISQANGRHSIYLINPDSSELVQITETSYQIFNYLNWSPDGKMIIYDKESATHSRSIQHEAWIMNADGTNPHVLSPDFGFFDWHP
jgi:WD40 repeat protein